VAKTFLLALIIVASSSIASAQADYKRWEIFGGYSHNLVDNASADFDFDPNTGEINAKHAGFNGFNAAITRNFSRYFGAKGDVSGHYRNTTAPFGQIARGVVIKSSLYNFLSGAQIKDNATESTFKPFAHALAGVAYSRNRFTLTNEFCIAIVPSPCPVSEVASETGFAGAVGGGLDIGATNRFDMRAIQIDYNPTRLGESKQNNFRIGVGLVFH